MSRALAPLALPFPAAVALRYLRSTRKDAFVSFLSLTAAGGIALGVAALILALSALTGFQDLLRGEILARTPQVQVEIPGSVDTETIDALVAEIGALPSVERVHRFVRGRGWIVAGGSVRAVEITGHDGDPPATLFPGLSGAGSGLYLSDRVAASWGLGRGDVLEVASSKPTLSPVGPQPRVRRIALAGTFEAGRTEQSERAAIPADEALRLFGRREALLEVVTPGLDEALAIAPSIERLAAEAIGSDANGTGSARIATWQDLNRPLFFALRLEKGVMFIAVFLIVVVASLALISGISLLISKKRPEIGMLGAMGAPPAALWRAFMTLGGLLALVGIGIGSALGIGGAWLLDRFELLRLPSAVYFVDHVPFAVHWVDVAAVLAATVALALLCTSFAASRAASLAPVEALRR